jgi:hypothetical protein
MLVEHEQAPRIADRQRVSKVSLRGLPLIKPDLARNALYVTGLVIPVTGLALGFAVWYLGSAGNPAWSIWTLAVLGSALIGLIVWLLVAALTNYGVLVELDRMVVFVRVPTPGVVLSRVLPWQEISRIHMAGGRGSDVLLWNTGPPVTIGPSQAREVLSDPRCPLRSIVPQEVVERIGLRAVTH